MNILIVAIRRVLDRILVPGWVFEQRVADGQKHWDETAEALAHIEEDEEVLEPGTVHCLCQRLTWLCPDCRRKDQR